MSKVSIENNKCFTIINILLDLTITGSLEINYLNGIDVKDLTKNPFKDGTYKKNLTVEVRS